MGYQPALVMDAGLCFARIAAVQMGWPKRGAEKAWEVWKGKGFLSVQSAVLGTCGI